VLPAARLDVRGERRLILGCGAVIAGLGVAAVVAATTVSTGGAWSDCGHRCPVNGLRIVEAPDQVARTLNASVHIVLGVLGAGAAVLVIRKARHARRLRRNAVMPLGYVLIASMRSPSP
jgi:hypothetical protein